MRAFFRMDYDFDYSYHGREHRSKHLTFCGILVAMFWRILTDYAFKVNLLPLTEKKSKNKERKEQI